MDAATIEAGLRAALPFNTTLGVEYDELSAARVVLRLRDRPELHNHVGGPHAGAIFSLGEAASGAIVAANFADLLAQATPLAGGAEIAYRKLALGDVCATATLGRPAAEVVAEMAAAGKAAFPVEVVVSDENGRETATMTVRWVLKRNA